MRERRRGPGAGSGRAGRSGPSTTQSAVCHAVAPHRTERGIVPVVEVEGGRSIRVVSPQSWSASYEAAEPAHDPFCFCAHLLGASGREPAAGAADGLATLRSRRRRRRRRSPCGLAALGRRRPGPVSQRTAPRRFARVTAADRRARLGFDDGRPGPLERRVARGPRHSIPTHFVDNDVILGRLALLALLLCRSMGRWGNYWLTEMGVEKAPHKRCCWGARKQEVHLGSQGAPPTLSSSRTPSSMLLRGCARWRNFRSVRSRDPDNKNG